MHRVPAHLFHGPRLAFQKSVTSSRHIHTRGLQVTAPAFHYQLDNGRLFLCKRKVATLDTGSSTDGGEQTDDASISAQLPSVSLGNLSCEAIMPGGLNKRLRYIVGLSDMAALAHAMRSGVGWECPSNAALEASTAALYLDYVVGQVIAHKRLSKFGLMALPTGYV